MSSSFVKDCSDASAPPSCVSSNTHTVGDNTVAASAPSTGNKTVFIIVNNDAQIDQEQLSSLLASHAGESSEVSVVQMTGAGSSALASADSVGSVQATTAGDLYSGSELMADHAQETLHTLPVESGQWMIQGEATGSGGGSGYAELPLDAESLHQLESVLCTDEARQILGNDGLLDILHSPAALAGGRTTTSTDGNQIKKSRGRLAGNRRSQRQQDKAERDEVTKILAENQRMLKLEREQLQTARQEKERDSEDDGEDERDCRRTNSAADDDDDNDDDDADADNKVDDEDNVDDSEVESAGDDDDDYSTTARDKKTKGRVIRGAVGGRPSSSVRGRGRGRPSKTAMTDAAAGRGTAKLMDDDGCKRTKPNIGAIAAAVRARGGARGGRGRGRSKGKQMPVKPDSEDDEGEEEEEEESSMNSLTHNNESNIALEISSTADVSLPEQTSSTADNDYDEYDELPALTLGGGYSDATRRCTVSLWWSTSLKTYYNMSIILLVRVLASITIGRHWCTLLSRQPGNMCSWEDNAKHGSLAPY